MLKNAIQGLEPEHPDIASADPVQRRTMVRVRCYCPVEVATERGELARGTVTDIGVGGLRLRCQAPLVPHATVTLAYSQAESLAETRPLQCRVLWVQNGRRHCVAGARFEETPRSWAAALLDELGFDEQGTYRRRRAVQPHAAIPGRVSRGREIVMAEARVVNLGLGGALLEGEEALDPGPVRLDMCLWRILPTLSIDAEILDVRRSRGTPTHSVRFPRLDGGQIRLLGNYLIYLIQQTAV